MSNASSFDRISLMNIIFSVANLLIKNYRLLKLRKHQISVFTFSLKTYKHTDLQKQLEFSFIRTPTFIVCTKMQENTEMSPNQI